MDGLESIAKKLEEKYVRANMIFGSQTWFFGGLVSMPTFLIQLYYVVLVNAMHKFENGSTRVNWNKMLVAVGSDCVQLKYTLRILSESSQISDGIIFECNDVLFWQVDL